MFDEFSPDPDLVDYEKQFVVILKKVKIPVYESDPLKNLHWAYQVRKRNGMGNLDY